MRFNFLVLVGLGALLIASSARATSYYVSAAGSDAGDGSQANPWQTLGKVNAAQLMPGDQVLFRRGDTFYGTLTPATSGAAGNPITFGAFGSGAKPVLTGLTSLAGGAFTSIGGGIWEASVPNGGAALNSLLVAGSLKTIGRYPKATAANGGYLSFDSHAGQTSITDAALAGAPNFADGEIVIRMVHWLDYRAPITAHSGNTLTFPVFSQSSTYPLIDGSGYFIQNHPAALTVDGEWYYRSSTKKVGIRSVGVPLTVEIPTVDRIVSMQSRTHLVFTDLAFKGSNAEAIYGNSVTDVAIQSCDIMYAGTYAIYINASNEIKIDHNTITESISDGVYFRNSMGGDITITDNKISRSGLIIGMSQGGRASNEAINVTVGTGAEISRNTIVDTGYVPIRYNGNDILIQNNVIDGFCSVLDDGSAIYTWNGSKIAFKNRRVIGNIVSRGIGAKEGTISGLTQANGIYLDNNSNHVEVMGNTVYGMANKGFHMNSPQDVVIANNTFFDNGVGWSMARWPDDGSAGGNGGQEIFNVDVHDNIFVNPEKDQSAFDYGDRGVNFPAPSTLEARIAAVGKVDGNHYYGPDPIPVSTYYRNDKMTPFVILPEKSLPQWQLFSSLEATSNLIPAFPDYKINALVGMNLYAQGTFEAGIGTIGTFPAGAATLTADTSGKLTGAGSLRIDLAPPANIKDFVLFYHSIGPVTQGKKYVLRVSTKGSSDYGLLRASIRKSTNPYTTLTTQEYSPFGKTRVDHEFILEPNATEPDGSWKIDILQTSGTVYIDDLEVKEADVTTLDPRARIRFEVNAEPAAKIVSLGQTYVDARDNPLCGDVTLAPYSSLVLFESDVPCTPSMGTGGSGAGGGSGSSASSGSSSSSGTGGNGGNGTGGNGETGGNGGSGATGNGGNGEVPSQSGGCDCTTAPRDASSRWASLAILIGAMLARKRRSH